MTISTNALELLINQKISQTLTDADILYLSKAIEQLRTGAIFVVSGFANLPASSTTPEGALYFVESDRALYTNRREINTWILLTKDYENVAWSWGFNNTGQLGDNTIVNKSSPVSVVGGVGDWEDIDAGSCFISGIRYDGSIWSWGLNSAGQLGDNTTVNKSSPVSIVGGFTDWCQVSAGYCHSLGIRTNGTLWAWGCNTNGRLGNNTTINRSSPVSVVGGFNDWCQVSAGGSHTAAVRSNGTLWTWGYNNSGMLADGTTVNRSSPVSVVGGFNDWCQVAAGAQSTSAIRANGTLWAWGCNFHGRLGDNTTVNRSSPVSVVGGFTDWCQVGLGLSHAAAIRTNGTLWTWGSNYQFQLGHGTTYSCSRSSPVSVIGGFTDWCQARAGYQHTSAIRTNGTLWSWGYNAFGQVGDGTATVFKNSPVSVVGNFTDWFRVSAGHYQTVAIRLRTF